MKKLRYEITIMIGPCTQEEALNALEKIADYANTLDIGAAASLTDEEPFANLDSDD